MKLAAWRHQAGLTLVEVSEQLECAVSSVVRYEKGSRIPEPDAMRAIYTLTRGLVSPDDFYDLPALPIAEAA